MFTGFILVTSAMDRHRIEDKSLPVYGLTLRIQTRLATLAPDIAARVCLNTHQQNTNNRMPITRGKGK